MNDGDKIKLRQFLVSILEKQGEENQQFTDDDSLISSGRIDSIDTLTIVMFLEKTFSINFADIDFDVDYVDSVNNIESFVDSLAKIK